MNVFKYRRNFFFHINDEFKKRCINKNDEKMKRDVNDAM